MQRRIQACWLGRVPYERAHDLQKRLLDARVAGHLGDTLLLLEHEPVITLGRGAKEANVLASREERARQGVELVETGRGGDVTFHGPGQLVAYPIFDLKPDRQDVRRYVRDLAEVMTRIAKDHGVAAGVVPGDAKLVGVWVNANDPSTFDPERAEAASYGAVHDMMLSKLGAIGVRLSRWVTMHGFAFNVSTRLAMFRSVIVPCGIHGLGITSLADLGIAVPSVEDVARASLVHFASVFDADVVLRDHPPLEAQAAGHVAV